MKKLLFVTTTNDKLFLKYAKVCLDEFDNTAGKNIDLINYVDVGSKLIFEQKNYKKIISKHLNSKEHETFLKYFSNFYEAQGFKIHLIKEDNGKNVLRIKPDFRFNAIRYSYKVFAMFEAYKHAIKNKYEYLIWTDADVRFKKKFEIENLYQFLPSQSEIMSYLGRTMFPTPAKPYSETGYLGFNIHHKLFHRFISDVINTYISGEIFSFEQWHDCWVFDRIRERYEENGAMFKNLSGEYKHLSHPYVNTRLGEFFDHFKGDARKINLKSHESDYK